MTRIVILSALLGCAFFFISFQKKPKFDLKASTARGKELYSTYCQSCHQEQGEGIEDLYPPLAKSDYLMADKDRSIQQILKGVSGEIKVNGKTYNMAMTGFELSDEETSDVVNYIRNSFGNKGTAVTPQQVAVIKSKNDGQK
jgi:mono/diheme cytochrome c family protein